MYKLYLALRYLRKRRITYFAVLSVALCTAMVLGAHSVFRGFLDTVKQSSRNLLGDLILEIGSMSTFPMYDEFIADMRAHFGSSMEGATPVIFNAGWLTLLVGPDDHRTYPAMIHGIRLDEYASVNRVGEGLYYNKHFPGSTTLVPGRKPLIRRDGQGRPFLPDELESALTTYALEHPDYVAPARQAQQAWPGPGKFMEARQHAALPAGYSGKPYPGLILGVGLVADRLPNGEFERQVEKGTLARLTVLPHNRTGAADSAIGVTAAFRYVDDARRGVHEIDSRAVYCDFAQLQKLLQLDGAPGSAYDLPRAAQIQVKMAPDVDLDRARAEVETLWGEFLSRHYGNLPLDDVDDMDMMRVYSWRQRNAAFINAVEKQRVLVLILLGVISLVAIVLVGCIFYMIVQERTAEIGIIKGMGACAWGIAGMFLGYAAAVGVVGSILGISAGTLFVHYINDIQNWLADLHPKLRMWNPEVYSFERIPNMVHAEDAAVIMLVGIAAAVIGSIAAAAKAAWIWPTRALYYK